MTSLDTAGGWATEQLSAFLAAVSELDEVDAALRCAVERAAEAVEAEIAAIGSGDRVLACVGFPGESTPHDELLRLRGNGYGKQRQTGAASGECGAHRPALPVTGMP